MTFDIRKQSGFSLITAIFLLVVLATLMGYMVNLRVVQQSTVVMSVQGARALQAARSGLEYGVYQALAGSCTNEIVSFSAAALQPFTVNITCVESTHKENTTSVNFYELTSTATSGSYSSGPNANPDYVSRRIRMTASTQPP